MKTKIQAQQYVCDLSPYQPGLPIELVSREYGLEPKKIIKLASNENPLGLSYKAKKALRRALSEAHRYPEQYHLVQALAQRHGVATDMIVLGNGSNDVLDLAARTFLNEGNEAISAQYGFAMYKIATQSVGATNVVVPARDYGHDLEAMLRAVTPRTKMIWIANPNNPTGTFVPYPEVQNFLERVPPEIVVVLDEAYYDYLPPAYATDSAGWLAEYPNLILVRTFSKMYGLAGLRIGYGIMSPEIAELFNRVRQPFNANVLALAAAVAALDDAEFVAKSFRINAAGRQRLIERLEKLGCEYLPSHGNFVTFRVNDAPDVYTKLLKQGVIVRPLTGYDMPEWLRVTIGLPEDNRRFLQALALALRTNR